MGTPIERNESSNEKKKNAFADSSIDHHKFYFVYTDLCKFSDYGY